MFSRVLVAAVAVVCAAAAAGERVLAQPATVYGCEAIDLGNTFCAQYQPAQTIFVDNRTGYQQLIRNDMMFNYSQTNVDAFCDNYNRTTGYICTQECRDVLGRVFCQTFNRLTWLDGTPWCASADAPRGTLDVCFPLCVDLLTKCGATTLSVPDATLACTSYVDQPNSTFAGPLELNCHGTAPAGGGESSSASAAPVVVLASFVAAFVAATVL